jgi:predicted O-methyltransferase YrrM
MIDNEWNSEPQVGKFIASLIDCSKARSVIEVGVFMGYTSRAMIEALPKGSHFVGIDIEDLRTEENKAFYEAAAKRGVVCEFIKGDSKQVLKQFDKHGFDIAFIDSAHYWQHILPEFKVAEKVIKKGGIIAYHDSIHIEDVAKLMKYAASFGYNKVDINTPEGRGLTLLQK